MKRLLKLLAMLTVVAPLPLSIVAYGSSSTSDSGGDETEPIDIGGLLDRVKTKIDVEFGKLIDNNDNLTYQKQFGEDGLGKTIHEYLNSLGDKEKITKSEVKDAFYDIIKTDIKTKIIPSLLADTSLKTLFNGIATNSLLTLELNESSLTNNNIDYGAKDDRFGISKYDPKNYDLTFFKEIVTNLKLSLSYKDKNDKVSTYLVDQQYTMYFANTGVKINAIVELATGKIKGTFIGYIIPVTFTMQQFNQRYIKKAVADVAEKKVEEKLKNPNIKIKESVISKENITTFAEDWSPNGDYKFYPYLEKNKVNFKADMINQENQYRTKWETKFDTWKKGKTITKPENVFSYGEYSLTEWKYSGLTLKTIDIPVTVSFNISREKSVEDMATKMAGLWASDGLLFNGSKFWNYGGNDFISWSMNSKDFDKYLTDNKNWYDVLKYLSEKFKTIGVKHSILTNDDDIRLTISRIDRDDDVNFNLMENKRDKNAVYKKIDNRWNFLYISFNGYRFTISPNVKSPQKYITIKRVEPDIWE